MNIQYCGEKCKIGKEKCAELLNKSDSVYDAASDFCVFIKKCFKTCPYKEAHIKENN